MKKSIIILVFLVFNLFGGEIYINSENNESMIKKEDIEFIVYNAKNDLKESLIDFKINEIEENYVNKVLGNINFYFDFSNNKINKNFNSCYFSNLNKSKNSNEVIKSFITSNNFKNNIEIMEKLKSSDNIIYIQLTDEFMSYSDIQEIYKYIYNISIHELTHSVGGSELLAKRIQEKNSKFYKDDFKIFLNKLLFKQYKYSLKTIINYVKNVGEEEKYQTMSLKLLELMDKEPEFIYSLSDDSTELEDSFLRNNNYYKMFGEREYERNNYPKMEYMFNILYDEKLIDDTSIIKDKLYLNKNILTKSNSYGMIWIIQELIKEQFTKEEIINFLYSYIKNKNVLYKEINIKNDMITRIKEEKIFEKIIERLYKRYNI